MYNRYKYYNTNIIYLQCVKAYVEFEINQGAYNISCPDAQCPKLGIIQLEEIEALVSIDEIEKHQRYRLNKGKSKSLEIYKT